MYVKKKGGDSKGCPAVIWLENNNYADLSAKLLFINLLERKCKRTKLFSRPWPWVIPTDLEYIIINLSQR